LSQAFAVRRFILGCVLSFMPLVAARALALTPKDPALPVGYLDALG
jgi:hypothetical protein